MRYLYSLPTVTSFHEKGLLGYTFGPLKQKDLEIYYIEVETGHETFMISRKITRTYYVLGGRGYFTIDSCRYDVSSGMLIEVPPRVEYSYSGKMTLIAISRPRWFIGNDTHTKWNPDVISGDFTDLSDRRYWLMRLVRLRIFGKSPVNAYLRLNHRLWNNLSASVIASAPMRSYGNFLHTLVRIQSIRGQLPHTFFLRNRPALELIRRVVERRATATVKVAVLGCSAGAEAYSVAWRIRSARPDLRLVLHAMDISKMAVEIGKCGVYSLVSSEFPSKDMFDGMSGAEMEELFERDGAVVKVKSWIKEGIEWHVGDVRETQLLEALGPQDIVVANNFLCHMDAVAAEKCLRNIARLVKPHGYLFVSGIDLTIRTKVAKELGWCPVQELLAEIHEGDPRMGRDWPWNYSALEPLNKRRRDWRLRYAAAFELIPFDVNSHDLEEGVPQRS